MDNRFITIVVGAAAFVAGVITTAIVESGSSSDGSQPQVITATQTVFPPPTYAAGASSSSSSSPAGTAHTVLAVSGTGEKSTTTFTVSGDWDVWYTYTSTDGQSLLSVQAIGASGDSTGLIDETTTGRTDTTHEHVGGTFSLKIYCQCDWKLRVIQLP